MIPNDRSSQILIKNQDSGFIIQKKNDCSKIIKKISEYIYMIFEIGICPSLTNLHFPSLAQDIIVLPRPLHSSQGTGPKRSTSGKSLETDSATKDVSNPEILALEVAKGPVSKIRDLAVKESGILIPKVFSLEIKFRLLFFLIGIIRVSGPGQNFSATF